MVVLAPCETRRQHSTVCVASCEKHWVNFVDLVGVLWAETQRLRWWYCRFQAMCAIGSRCGQNVTELSQNKYGAEKGVQSHFQKTSCEEYGPGPEKTTINRLNLLHEYNSPVLSNQSGLNYRSQARTSYTSSLPSNPMLHCTKLVGQLLAARRSACGRVDQPGYLLYMGF